MNLTFVAERKREKFRKNIHRGETTVEEPGHSSLSVGGSGLNMPSENSGSGLLNQKLSYLSLKQKTNDEAYISNYSIKEKHSNRMKGFFEAEKQMRHSFASLMCSGVNYGLE